MALEVRDLVEKSGYWKESVVTEITKAQEFYRAEEHWQHYEAKEHHQLEALLSFRYSLVGRIINPWCNIATFLLFFSNPVFKPVEAIG